MRFLQTQSLAIAAALATSAGHVFAQPAPDPVPAPEPEPADEPATPVEPGVESEPASDLAPVADVGTLRVHILGTRGAYLPLAYDVFSVATQQLVGSGVGALVARGEKPTELSLPPGLYKIVRSGESFDARVDFAFATIEAGATNEYVIMVDPDTFAFRGSGPVIGELPRGKEIAGIRVSLNGGGNMMFNQRRAAVGTTSGQMSQFGLFGNFGMVLDRGVHFVDVSAEAQLDLVDPVTGSIWPSRDRFAANGLYSYKLNNPYLGPYVRASMETHIFPGYLYLESADPTIPVVVNRLDGTTDTITLGNQADPDDLRLKISKPFGPFKLQEELGANVKAVDVDLLLFKLVVGTRVGFGFRQAFMNGLLVARNQDSRPVILDEIDDYTTLGPVIGANAKVTFARWLFGSATFGMLAPLTNRDQSRSDNFGGRLLIDFAGTAGFKVPILTNLLYASADYTFRLERDGFITARTQFEHSLMARATVTLF